MLQCDVMQTDALCRPINERSLHNYVCTMTFTELLIKLSSETRCNRKQPDDVDYWLLLYHHFLQHVYKQANKCS